MDSLQHREQIGPTTRSRANASPRKATAPPHVTSCHITRSDAAGDAMAEEVRVFMGRRLDCAQCHNHPYENWSQDQFWGMAAFFSRLFKMGPVVIDHPVEHGPELERRGREHRICCIRARRLPVKPALLDDSTSRCHPGRQSAERTRTLDDVTPILRRSGGESHLGTVLCARNCRSGGRFPLNESADASGTACGAGS